MMALAASPVDKKRKQSTLVTKTEQKKAKLIQQKQHRDNAIAQTPLISAAATKNTFDLQTERPSHVPSTQFGGMRAECVNDDFLYRVSHVAGDLLESASLVIRESGITIQTTDPQSIAVVIIDLPAKMFSSYRCEGHFVAHINMETLVGMLKLTGADNAKFKLTLEIRADDQERMYITIFDAKKCTTTEHVVVLWEPKDIIIYFDGAQFDYYRVVSSRGWHEEISDLSHLVEPSKPIRITAGNDLKLSIDGDYGESTKIFKQDKTPGYKVVQKRVDPTKKDADGNYLFFREIEGSAPQTSMAAVPASERKVGRKAKTPKKEKKSRRNNEDGESEDEEDEADEESIDYATISKYAKPIVETEEENAKIVDTKPPIEEIKITLSMLLVRMVSKGLRQTPELYLLFKKNYPVMFVQRMKEYGHILIAISPKALDDDENAANEAEVDEQNAMNQLMALGKE